MRRKTDGLQGGSERELVLALDDAIGSLPVREREAIILRYIQQKSENEVAEEMGRPRGSISSWLSRGLSRLRAKLARKGTSISIAAIATLISTKFAEAAPVGFVANCALLNAAGGASAPANVSFIAKGAMKMMMWAKVKTVAAICALTVAAGGAGVTGVKALSVAAEPAPQPYSSLVYTGWPFDATEAAERQDETVKALGINKEVTLDLGGDVKMAFVLIPAGKFMMGSPTTEKYRSNSELLHEVTISKPFYMGKYPVTHEQWTAVMETEPWTEGFYTRQGPTYPAGCIAWNDAVEFCKKLSQKTGRSIGLPTEAQWEYACRSGTNTAFFCGDDDANLGEYGWYVKTQAAAPAGRGPQLVGQKKPNAWGLHDMCHMWQWCVDWLGPYEDKAQTDPTGPASGTVHVFRGAGWYYPSGWCRSAHRHSFDPTVRGNRFGVRVVLDVK